MGIEHDLERLASIDVDDIQLNVGPSDKQERFNRRLGYVVNLAGAVLESSLPIKGAHPLQAEIKELVQYISRAEGQYMEIRGGGSHVLSLIDRVIGELTSLAAAFGLTIVEQGDSLEARPVGRPDLEEMWDRIEHAEQQAIRAQEALGDATLEEVDQTLKEIHSARNKIHRLLEEASTDVTQLKVGDYHQLFEKTAEGHRERASKWLWATASLAILGTIAAIFFAIQAYYWPVASGHQIEFSIAKALVVTVLLSGAIWAGLNYRSHQHNAVVNKHRGDALGTFDAFRGAALGEEAKDAVLVHASNSIYLPQPSGFSGKEGESASAGWGLLATLNSQKE